MANNDEDRYVVKHADGWAVKKENAKRASNAYDTQAKVIARAREIADNSGRGPGELRIQAADGNFRDSDSGRRNETRTKSVPFRLLHAPAEQRVFTGKLGREPSKRASLGRKVSDAGSTTVQGLSGCLQ